MLSLDVVDQAEHLSPAAAGRNRDLLIVVIQDGPYPVPVSREQARQHADEVDHDRLFMPLDGAESHRRTHV